MIIFWWRILRIFLFISGMFLLSYGIGNCLGQYGFYIGCIGAGLASTTVAVLMAKN